MRISPLEIQQQKFKVKLMGFNREEVISFLELISNEMEDLKRENRILKGELEKREKMIAGYKQREKNLNESIITAQKITEDMKLNVKKEADLIISEAEMKAEKIIDDAHRKKTDIEKEIFDLKKQRLQLNSALRLIIEEHLKLLDLEKENNQKDI
ncbi:MAG: DivIVA domain-containing protein [Thermodesulfobacteriota bacterium]|nr:DivIVA domain-containing protein [Thermodesulfobacteriota bacterium]